MTCLSQYGSDDSLLEPISYKLGPILIHCQVDGAKGASPNLLINYVLVDAVLGGAIVFAVAVLGSRVQRLLRHGRVRNGGGAGH